MSRLKTLIDANIKENGNQEITGNVLNYVLNEIADEVKREGYFPDMSVGFADNLVGRGESVPAEFTFRASGGKSIKDGAARIKRIKGNSVVVNGEVIHMNTESIKSVGDNAWDEEWEEGIVDEGNNYFIAGYIRSKNYIKVLPDAQYHYIASKGTDQDYIRVAFYNKVRSYLSMQTIGWNKTFTIPSNAHYVRFYVNDTYGSTYKHDIMLTLVHSGWKQDTDAGYQPYWQDTLPLPIIRKYFPDGMKSAGSAYDEIRYNKASGKWEKVVRIGSVDMGSLDWEVASNNRMIATSLENVLVKKDASNDTLLCAKYTNAYPSEVYLNTSDRIICSTNVGHIFVYDSAYTDAASFKAAMQGVILYYELAEPVIREIDEPIGTDYRVADFGTEQAISSIPSAPFSADIIYQFNAVDMIRELWLKVQELESRVAQL